MKKEPKQMTLEDFEIKVDATDFADKNQVKELAIQHFKSKYNCTWKDNNSSDFHYITLTFSCKEYDSMEVSFKKDGSVFFNHPYDGSLEMYEDLISILHLYYLGEE